MVIKDTPYVSIVFNVTAEILLIDWIQIPSTKQFKDSYFAALQFVEQKGTIISFCTNLSVIGSLSREQEAWLMLEYYPKVYQCIGENINAAVVFSEEHFKAIVTNYQQPTYLARQEFINFNYFTVFEEAMHWLAIIKKGQDSFSSMIS
ncbi:hypothetical protein [uncultured Pontibacter sp.]|uniref:hypothetical protein n=1 Tax=uncultured Pontibacter sp. TaxID=453356 RepID=UPI0026165D7A|nr:hypothetical protein [uncultured Pontibacter sp.]